jgi:hypothetical protein
MTIQKIKAGRVPGQDPETYVGNDGQLFYDEDTGILRISDGVTPGGTIVSGGSGGSYTLPTATTTVKGGVKIDGTTITINNQIISAVQQDLSSYATQTYVTTRGYLTSVGTISYTDLSNKPTLFSGSYADLTNKPTLVTSYTQLTDKPNLAGTYTFNVAADDSTLRTIGSEETVKFIGANGITTSSDDEGAVTITLGDTLTWTNPSPAPATPWRTTINAESGNANIVLYSGLPGFGSSVSWTLDETKLTFPDTTEQTTAWTGTAAAGTLTGDTLNSTVVTSSLTSVGTLTGLTVGGTGGDLTMTGGAITGVGNITAAGILAVNASGGITTNQTAFDIVNSTATTVNLGGAATAVNIGAITGTLTLNNPTVVGSQTSLTLFNTTATTVSAFGAATTATIGANSGTLTLRNPTVVGTQTTVNLWNTTSTTVNAFGAATAITIGAATGTTSIRNSLALTHTPATATGYAITATGKDTQGGIGWFDFLKATNTTSGATNPNKSFRLNSTGGIEIINSAYSATLLTLTDAGAFSVASTVSSTGFYVNNKQAVNGPAFRAYIDGSQTISSGSQQKVTFGAETFDTNANFATSRFTPNVEGYYQLNATVRISGPSSTGECMLIIWKNGSEYARGTNESGTEQGASFYSMQVSDIAYANGSSDYFEIYIQQVSGSNRDTTAGSNISYFSGSMIRGA